MDDESEVRFVESHAQRRGGHQRLDPIVLELLLEFRAFFGIGPARIGADLVALFAQHSGDVLGSGDGERVDDSGPGEVVEMGGQPGDAGAGVEPWEDAEAQGISGEFTADDCGVVAELFGDVGDDAGVRCRRRREYRGVTWQFGQNPADAAVVGAEIVAPIGDAVGFVDDDESEEGQQLGQHFVAELRIVQPFRGDEEDVETAGLEVLEHGIPFGDVRGVETGGTDSGTFGRGDLVAHERQQRGDDETRPGARGPEHPSGHEVHR